MIEIGNWTKMLHSSHLGLLKKKSDRNIIESSAEFIEYECTEKKMYAKGINLL